MALELRSRKGKAVEVPEEVVEPKKAPKKKANKKKTAKKTDAPKGVTTHAHGERDGASIVAEETAAPRSSDGPMANVNVNLGTRQGLPNYSDVRYGCSITIPCEPTAEGIEEAYQFGEKWCLEKMDELHEKCLSDDDA